MQEGAVPEDITQPDTALLSEVAAYENEEATIRWPFSPFVWISGKPDGLIDPAMREKTHWMRFMWLALLAVLYCLVLRSGIGNEDFLSGEIKEAVEEFFADAGKSAERITEGEVTPGFKEFIHGDDVSKTLTWIQMFCMNKRGSDDHVPWAWLCDLNQVEIDNMHPVPWDVIHNIKDNDRTGTVSGKNVNQSESQVLQEFICKRSFLDKHVVQGDRPFDYGTRAGIPFGDIDRFREQIAKEHDFLLKEKGKAQDVDFNPCLHPDFDEYTVLDGNPMWEPMDEHFEELDEKIYDGFERVDRKISKLAEQQQSHGSSSFMHGMLQTDHASSGTGRNKLTVHEHDGASTSFPPDNCQGVICKAIVLSLVGEGSNTQIKTSYLEKMKASKIKRRSKMWTRLRHKRSIARLEKCDDEHKDADNAEEADEDEDEEDEDEKKMKEWCANDFSSEVNRLLDAASRFDINVDNTLSKHETRHFFKEQFNVEEADFEKTWDRIDADGNGNASIDEMIAFSRSSGGLLEGAPPMLKSTCLNHHWGMLHICGPERISANFHIERTNEDPLASVPGVVHRQALIDIKLEFHQVGYDNNPHSSTSGWYQSKISVAVQPFFGRYSSFHAILAILVLLLFTLLFIPDMLMTVLLLPWKLCMLCLPAKRKEIDNLFKVQNYFLSLQDARLVRARYLGGMLIVQENIFCIVFIVAACASVYDAFKPDVPMLGQYPRDKCRDLYEQRMIQSYKQDMHSSARLLVTPLDFISTCLPDDADVVAETIMQYFFDARKLHGLAFFLLLLRLFDFFSAFEATRWLPQTIELSLRKLFNFLIFYFCIIFAFAFLLNISMGVFFVQFHDFQRASFVLILFSFGFTDQALDGLQPFEDKGSMIVIVYLLLFAILVVSVAMQFFTTIILDAYAQLADPENFKQKKLEERIMTMIALSYHLFPCACEPDDIAMFKAHELRTMSAERRTISGGIRQSSGGP